jgi:hypothetical protein
MIKLNKAQTKLQLTISGTEFLEIGDDILKLLSVRVPIDKPSALQVTTLSGLFSRAFNTKSAKQEVKVVISLAEGVCLWQVFSRSQKRIWQSISYALICEITSKTNIMLK